MTRYLSLLGLLFLGVGALALASQNKAASAQPRSLPDEASPDGRLGRMPLPSVPSYHARFSLN